MYISYKWLKELTEFPQTPEELEQILTMLGIEVEKIINYSKKYENFFTAKVLTVEKHPKADKLTICTVSTGDIDRTVICGAPNVAAGQNVVLGIPGAIVPQSGMLIESRKIRDVRSEGMICSQAELELSDDHSGIWVLPDDAPVGIPFAEYSGQNDIIFEVSLTPNRADCLSHYGIAREIASYNKTSIAKTKSELIESSIPSNNTIDIIIEDIEKCPRYTGRVIKCITVKESPQWLKSRLLMLGMRPINIIVDVTNYVLLECGQPLHAFDLNRLAGNKIIVKTVNDGEKFTTLDSKERILDSRMLMICDGERPVAIGGVMGGENSEINNNTKDILIESAFFDPSSIRRTSKKLGIQSEASYRFERGVDIENIDYASDRAAALIAEYAGGTIEQGIIDIYPVKNEREIVQLRYKRTAEIIGIEIAPKQIIEILNNLNFKIINEDENSLTCEIPAYRVDIKLEIDLIEEIARLYNYDNISPDYTALINFSGESVPVKLAIPALRQKIRDFLVPNGFHEILTQNMIDPASVKIFTDNPIQISNPLGEELSLMRPTLVPSMLRTILRNLRVGNSELRLYEIGRTFNKIDDEKNFITGVQENEELLISIAGKVQPVNWSGKDRNVDFYDIKGILSNLLGFFKFDNLELNELTGENPVFSSDSLEIIADNNAIGFVGEVSKKLLNNFDVEIPIYIINLNLSMLYNIERRKSYYKAVPPFPGIQRDIAFILDAGIRQTEIRNEILMNGGELLKSVELFDLYEGKNIGEGKKNMAFSLRFQSYNKTLTDEEVNESIANIVNAIEKKFDAKLRKF